MKLEIYQVDAFTSEPFHGNPAAVVPLEKWLDSEMMLDIAAENNLAETAFFVPNGGGFDLKWFTPTVEIDLCGHATLGTAFVLWNQLGYTKDAIDFETRSGRLTVKREGQLMVMDFPSRPANPTDAPAGLAAALGAEPIEVLKARDLLCIYSG